MNSITGIVIALVAGLSIAAAVGCQSVPASPSASEPVAQAEPTPGSIISQPPVPTTGGQPAQTSTPAQPEEPAMVEVLAPIQEAHVNIAESFPPQYFLEVTSGLPNGCIRFEGYDVAREGDTVNVTVTNLEPEKGSLMACTMQYGIVKTNIPLGSDFEPGKTYTVLVNDVTETFTAQGDASTAPGPAGSIVLGNRFPLEEGQTATIESEALDVSFVKVTEDSRCPRSVTCIWAGQAKVVIGVSDAKTGEDLGQSELALAGGGGEAARASFGRYSVEIVALDPYPAAPDQGERPDYTATLVVSETDPGSKPDDSQPTTDGVTVRLRGNPAPGQPLTMIFTVEILGGPDNDKELYCQETRWEFGDGRGAATMPMCVVWTPEAKINRHYEQTHTYEGPGVYRVTFTYGPLPSETIAVDLR